MSVKLRPVNSIGNYVREDSPHKVGYAAASWKCDGCGCGKLVSDVDVWKCECKCHDGWKFLADGGRYREQVANRKPEAPF